MKASPARHFLSLLAASFESSIDAYFDYVETLTFDDPTLAAEAAEAIPLLALFLDTPDERARALGIAASAFIAGNRLPRARPLLDEADELASTPTTRALLKSRRAQSFTAQNDWEEVRMLVSAGLELIQTVPDLPEAGAVKCRLDIQFAGVMLYADQNPIRSAKRSLSVIRHPVVSERLRRSAIANFTTALATLEPRVALRFLELVHSWVPKPRAGFADYVLAWIDGHLRALAARDLEPVTSKEQRRMARRRLVWAAKGLFTTGHTADALMALMDLLTLGYQGRAATGEAVELAETILTEIRDDPDIALDVQRQAAHYLETRNFAHANHLRAAIIAHLHDGLFPHLRQSR